MKSVNITITFWVLIASILCSNHVDAKILWQQNFNSSPVWQSVPGKTSGMKYTHNDAISMWNASSYRAMSQIMMLEVSPLADRQGSGKGLIYYFNSVNAWQAASIDLDFSDPDVQWATPIDRSGYQELWLTEWYKTPEKQIWYDPERGEEVPVGFELWKGCRFWAYDENEFITKYNTRHSTNFSLDANGHWGTILDSNAVLSSHYLDSGTFYKKPFFIPCWYGQTLYFSPAWLKETDADAGTSGFPSAQNRNDYSTHLIEGKKWWGEPHDPIPGILGDLQWHKIEYHVKLNDLGQANSIEEVYVDGSPTPLTVNGNNLEMRITDRKIHQVILFDNYGKMYGGKQPLYIDDITLSTHRLSSEGSRKIILNKPTF